MQLTTNQILLERLLHLHPKTIDLSLNRIINLLSKIENPEKKLKNVITVTGTNGKGSTIQFLRSILEAHGKTVNFYISPHLQRFNERINIAGKEIDNQLLNEVLSKCEQVNGKDPITFFEITTAAAYLAFSKYPADFTILETGLGGRLDATNVIEQPIAQILTPISFDHQEFLGDTLAKITYEKCAIFKNNTKIIISKQTPEVLKYIDHETKKNTSNKILFGEDFQIQEENNRFIFQDEITLLDLDYPNLKGKHQLINAATAIATAKILLNKIDTKKTNTAIKNTKNKGRLDKILNGKLREFIKDENELYIDGSHNEDGAKVTSEFIKTLKGKKIYLILGMLKTKSTENYLKYFSDIITSIKAITIPHYENCKSPEEIVKIAEDYGMHANVSKSIIEALHEISNEDPKGIILISGSLYLAGEALNLN